MLENRGEGVFFQIKSEAIDKWLARTEVQNRGRKLDAGFECWKADHKQSRRVFPGLPYLFLHSLSHLLISAVSLECGYPSSSIRERIYPGGGGYGILLYTGSPDSEGTMGGLVEAGRQIPRVTSRRCHRPRARTLLERPGLRSNISRTMPTRLGFSLELLGHGCLLIPETCCEQQNDFLDRSLVVSTVDQLGAEFFPSQLS